ncbi:hypothetical protein CRG98_025505 [Punica granatum]|uniref:Uncharacterized protein n=1 Tax=Punica granatum TaxID=22663 RepID=A0A2I0JDV7_PUNGR|nr:hypothetical protein CRG98_025505 [Punica granatum]
MERSETKWRLRHSMELKERELESLRAKGEGVDESEEVQITTFSSDTSPMEQQGRWAIEKDVTASSMKRSIRES